MYRREPRSLEFSAGGARTNRRSYKWVMFWFLACLGLGIVASMWGAEKSLEMPRSEFTPGMAQEKLTKDVLCAPSFRTGPWRHVSEGQKKVVFNEYGIPWDQRSHYEVDHLIAITDGGSNDIKNLWPQPLKEAREKDKVEVWAHKQICEGTMDLQDVQDQMANDWWGLYQRMLTAKDRVMKVPDFVN